MSFLRGHGVLHHAGCNQQSHKGQSGDTEDQFLLGILFRNNFGISCITPSGLLCSYCNSRRSKKSLSF